MSRALVLCEFPSLNGGERSFLSTLPHLERAGWTIDFACPPQGPLAEALRRRGNVVVPTPSLSDSASFRESLPDIVHAALSARRYDLLHANSLSTAVLAGPIGVERRVPSLGHLRDIVGLSRTKVGFTNLHARLLAVSAATRDFHVAQGFAADRVHVLHNGVDLETFAPQTTFPSRTAAAPLHDELGLPSDVPLVGLIGQIILRKGFDVALAALGKALRTRPTVHIVVVGTRHTAKAETVEYERKLRQIAAETRFADRVHWLGTRDDVPAILRELKLLVHTPRQEPLGRVLLEGAASGVPIVATDVGGTREIFPGEVADGAILVPVDDVVATAAAIERILDADDLRERMSSAGRSRIQAAFTVERTAAELLRHYQEVSAVDRSSTIFLS